MKSFLKYFFLLLLLIAIPGTIWVISEKESEKVLSIVSTPIESPSPTPTQTPTPIPSPTPTPTPVPSPTPPPPPPISPQEIHAFIERFSAQYGVDPNVLRHLAVCESGFNPLAQKAGYAGLYQFGPLTWKNYRILMGEDPNPNLRLNAEEAVQTAAFVLSQGKTSIWPNCAP